MMPQACQQGAAASSLRYKLIMKLHVRRGKPYFVTSPGKPPMNVRAFGAAPLNVAFEKSNPGCCRCSSERSAKKQAVQACKELKSRNSVWWNYSASASSVAQCNVASSTHAQPYAW
jgi:hypothetical protein